MATRRAVWVVAGCLFMAVVPACGDDDDGSDGDGGSSGRSSGGSGGRAFGGAAGKGGASQGGGANNGGVGEGGSDPSSGGTTSGGGDTSVGGSTPGGAGADTGGTIGTAGAPTGGTATGGTPTGGAGVAGGTSAPEGGAGGTGGSATGGSPTDGGAGSGGEGGNVPDGFHEPLWLGDCSPLELSDDASTVLATKGVWTRASGWRALPSLPGGDDSNTPLAMSRDGHVVFGASSSALGDELYRWTAATGVVGLGQLYLAGSKVSTNVDGSVLLAWGRNEVLDKIMPFRWRSTDGIEWFGDAGDLDEDGDEDEATCTLANVDSYAAFLSGDATYGVFVGWGPNNAGGYCQYFPDGVQEDYAADEWRIVSALSANGLVAAAQAPDQGGYGLIYSPWPGSLSNNEVCVQLSGNPHGEDCYGVTSRIHELALTPSFGLGIEKKRDSEERFAVYYVQGPKATVSLRKKFDESGYCLEPAPVPGQISGDGKIVLGVGQSREQSGCFLADLDAVPALPEPELPSGYGCPGACDGEAIVSGDGHTCALRLDGSVDCWGRGDSGQLGDGRSRHSSRPVRVSGLANARQLASTSRHSCARLANGQVWCWGLNSEGQLGNGSLQDSPVPVQVALPQAALQVAAGISHTCALLSDRTVRCWGKNASGQLGNGTTTSSNVPVTVVSLTDVKNIAAGLVNTCAVVRTGTKNVWCWGNTLTTPVNYMGISGGTTSKVSMHGSGYCFVAEGSPLAWSRVFECNGPYARAGTRDENLYWGAASDPDIQDLRPGGHSWCMQVATGEVGCFSTIKASYDYSDIEDRVAYTQVAPGNNHICWLNQDTTVRCTGDASYGALGNGVPTCDLAQTP